MTDTAKNHSSTMSNLPEEFISHGAPTNVDIVSTLSSELHQLRVDNETLRTQFHALQQVPSLVHSVYREAASCSESGKHNTLAKSYRDALCPAVDNPGATAGAPPARSSLLELSTVSSDNPSDGDFINVSRAKRANPSATNTTAIATSSRKPKVAMIGVRISSSLSVVQKRRNKSLFVSRFSPDVTASDVENSLRDQLQLASLTCTRLKTKHDSYASFHISVTEVDFPLINNTGVWSSGCLIAPYYGRLSAEQLYNAETPATARSPSPVADRPCPPSPPTPDSVDNVLDGGSANTVGPQGEGSHKLKSLD